MTALMNEALEAMETRTDLKEVGISVYAEEFYSSYMEDGVVRLVPERCSIEVLEDGTMELVGCGADDGPVYSIAGGKERIARYRERHEAKEA